jgi:hypothetical protein
MKELMRIIQNEKSKTSTVEDTEGAEEDWVKSNSKGKTVSPQICTDEHR